MQIDTLIKLKDQLYQIAAKYGVKKIYLFGSVARGESNESSDIDFLLEMDEGTSAFGIGGFQFEVQRLLGVRVDVIPAFVLPYVLDKEFVAAVHAEAIAL